ncbi:hypothetical protein WMF30_30595 [Sorangium sp. So ce134]
MKNVAVALAAVGLLTSAFLLRAGRGRSGVAMADESSSVDRRVAGFHGRYGYYATGTVLGVGSLAANGVITFRHDGTLTAEESVNVNGRFEQVSYTGWYTLNPDGTGTFTTQDPSGGISDFRWVLTANRARGSAIIEEAAVVGVMVMERQ